MSDKRIDQLPSATQVNDADLFVLEQSATAKQLAGSVFKRYVQNAVSPYVAQAQGYATQASTYASNAQTYANTALDKIYGIIYDKNDGVFKHKDASGTATTVSFATVLQKLQDGCDVYADSSDGRYAVTYYDSNDIYFTLSMIDEDEGYYDQLVWNNNGSITGSSISNYSTDYIDEQFESQSVEIAKLQALGLFIDADGDVAQHDNI